MGAKLGCREGYISSTNGNPFNKLVKYYNRNLFEEVIMVSQKLEWSAIDGQEHPVLAPAWTSNNHVFTSGIIGQNYKTGEIKESIENQTKLAIENVKNVLEKTGTSVDKVFKVLMFISDAKYSEVVNQIYEETFTQKPARSCVVVAFMDDRVKVELEVIASIN